MGRDVDLISRRIGKTALVSALFATIEADCISVLLGFSFVNVNLTVIVSSGRVLIQEEAALAVLPVAVGESREWTG